MMGESCKIQHLELFNRMMERRSGGSVEWQNILRWGVMEYSKMQNAFLYETKVLIKWNCNKIRKLCIIGRQNYKKHTIR